MQTTEYVQFLVDLALAQELIHRLHGPRLNRGETVQFENAAQFAEDHLLNMAFRRQELRDTAELTRTSFTHLGLTRRGLTVVGLLWACQSIRSTRKGLVARSRAMDVWWPCPGRTAAV